MSSDPNTRQSQYVPNGMEGYRPYEHQAGQLTIPYNRSWHIAKIVIRSFDIVFCWIVIGISAYLTTTSLSSAIFLIFSGFPAVAAAIWDNAELITICARGGRRGIHPGAHVALHLIFWLVFATAVGFESTLIWLRDADSDYPSSRRVASILNRIIPLQNTVAAFTVLLLIGHFTLFVRACVETNQRNRRPPVFMVPAHAPAPMQPQMVAGSYAPYPYAPQQAYVPVPQERGQISGANTADMNAFTPPGPDGTYYAPTSHRA